MKVTNSIGIIDSGVGGLTVATEVIQQLPNEHIIYLGDNARCPYGSRTKKEIIEYTFEIVDYLLHQNIKALVIACNTMTAYTLDLLKEKLSIPVIGVIQPGARAAVKQNNSQTIGVIGTEATISSNAYPETLHTLNPEIKVISAACPLFVPYVERGIFEGDLIDEIVSSSLIDIKNKSDLDTLILGCTHFPLLKKSIQKVLGNTVKIISPSQETAQDLKAILREKGKLLTEKKTPTYTFYTTGELKNFEKLIKLIFPEKLFKSRHIYIEHLSLVNIK